MIIEDKAIIESLIAPIYGSNHVPANTNLIEPYYFDSRFVLLLDNDSKVDTIAFGSGPMAYIRINDDYLQNDSCYNATVSYIANNNRYFRKWYRRHYHKGEWHFYYWRKDKKVSR